MNRIATAIGILAALPSVAVADDVWVEVAPGVEIHVIDEGQGQPLVLIPGWTFAAEIFEHQIEAFAEDWRVIAMDPRGHGLSTQTVIGNDYITQADDLTAVLDALEVEQPVLVGWSFGCLATWGYVGLHGTDAIAGHVCIDLAPLTLSDDPSDWTEGPLRDIAGAYHLLRSDTGHRDFVRWFTDEVMVQRELTDDEMTRIVEQSMRVPYWNAAALWASGMFMDMRTEAQTIDAAVPSLFVIAEHWQDIAVPYVNTLLPNTRAEVLGGHMMFWEYPDEFNAILADFLASMPQ